MNRSSSKQPYHLSATRRALLDALLKEKGVDSTGSQRIPKRAELGPVPLSFAQWRLFYFDKLVPGSAVYNVPKALRLSGPLDVPTLERGFNEIIRRHENLRTTFSIVDGQPLGIIARSLTLDVPIVDLRTFPKQEREEESIRRANEEARRPFDLVQGPLLRTALWRLQHFVAQPITFPACVVSVLYR